MERYKKVINAINLIIEELESDKFQDIECWSQGHFSTKDFIICVLREHAIDLLRTQQLIRTNKLVEQIKKRYGNK